MSEQMWHLSGCAVQNEHNVFIIYYIIIPEYFVENVVLQDPI